MRLVLPTLWSPNSTILVRLSVFEDGSVIGEFGEAIVVMLTGLAREVGKGMNAQGYAYRPEQNKRL